MDSRDGSENNRRCNRAITGPNSRMNRAISGGRKSASRQRVQDGSSHAECACVDCAESTGARDRRGYRQKASTTDFGRVQRRARVGRRRLLRDPGLSAFRSRPMTAPREKAFPVSWDQFHRDARALAWRLASAGPFDAHRHDHPRRPRAGGDRGARTRGTDDRDGLRRLLPRLQDPGRTQGPQDHRARHR